MPRKFLGQRINISKDFVRPASLTLTSEDLSHIPETCRYDTDDYVFGADVNCRKISRKFGGTKKLKQRLSSVPELFLYDLKKLEKKSTLKLLKEPSPPQPNNLSQRSSPLVTVKEEQGCNTSSYHHLVLQPEITLKKNNKSFQSRIGNTRKPTSPLSKKPMVKSCQDILVFPATVVTESPEVTNLMSQMQHPFLQNKNKTQSTKRLRGCEEKSCGELLFDEILSAYTSLSQDQRPFSSTLGTHLGSKNCGSLVNRSMKKDLKNDSSVHTPIIRNEDILIGDKDILRSFPPARPVSVLEENISSPEYSNSSGSDPSSSGEDFSDIDSIVPNAVLVTTDSLTREGTDDEDDDEVYHSANDGMSTEQHSVFGKKASVRYISSVTITPKIVNVADLMSDDEEDQISDRGISLLQQEIEELDICDASSSMYSS